MPPVLRQSDDVLVCGIGNTVDPNAVGASCLDVVAPHGWSSFPSGLLDEIVEVASDGRPRLLLNPFFVTKSLICFCDFVAVQFGAAAPAMLLQPV